MYSFIDRLNGSLQNRHFIFSSRNIILHKNNLMTLLNNSIENIVHSRLNDVNMYLQNSCREYFDLKIRLKAVHMAVVLVNIFFLVEIINFLASPTMNTLFALSIKIITDIFVIYTDYNNMKIKFPKIEFLIFSIVYPFYFVKNFVVTRLIYRG